MADIKITGNQKVSTLQSNWKKEFGSTLRLYDGNRFADGNQTVGDIAKKTISRGSEVSANGNKKVGNFENEMKETYGIRIQIANSDNSKLVDNDITLSQSGRVSASGQSNKSAEKISDKEEPSPESGAPTKPKRTFLKGFLIGFVIFIVIAIWANT